MNEESAVEKLSQVDQMYYWFGKCMMDLILIEGEFKAWLAAFITTVRGGIA